MKKILSILLVICMALSVCACSGGDSDAPQKGSDRESYSPDYGELYYEANGIKFGIMDYADEVMEKLPEPSGSFENESCAYQGKDTVYYYDGFELTVHKLDGDDRIIGVKLTDDTVQTPQGLLIGMSETDCASVIDGLGGEKTGATVYTVKAGSTALIVGIGSDATVSSIEFAVISD